MSNSTLEAVMAAMEATVQVINITLEAVMAAMEASVKVSNSTLHSYGSY